MKLQKGEEVGDYLFYCTGCNCHHLVTTERKNDRGAQWRFNGNMEAPTFYPSIHIWVLTSDEKKKTICHSYVSNGFIQYLLDSDHELKGQTIELSNIN